MVTFYTKLNKKYDDIYINEDNTSIKIMNRTYAQDSANFYFPLINWIAQTKKYEPEKLSNLNIIYMDSSISTILSDIDSITNLAKDEGLDIELNWSSDDEDLDMGSNYTYRVQKLRLKLIVEVSA